MTRTGLKGGMPEEGRRRVVIENVRPQVDGGRFPAKRVVGDEVRVEADIFVDGHDAIACVLHVRRVGETSWTERPMAPLLNDRWAASFIVQSVGEYEYTVLAWADHFASWQRDFKKKLAAGQDVTVDLKAGVKLVREALARAKGSDPARLGGLLDRMSGADNAAAIEAAQEEELAALMFRTAERQWVSECPRPLRLRAERKRAEFSTWYELFPRSAAAEPGKHGTLRDVIARLDYIAEMGFDVLYLPPIHPIGRTFRKGRNNAPTAAPGDVGSPWAIGGPEGGHKAIHPELGSFEDFEALRAAAEKLGIELALDIAFQCSPDHPYVKDHPEWFKKRPDGTIQYAENPPKKYQDIYPFDFESPAWESLWEELASVMLFWCERGVRIFRVDNPHTKAMPFWEWAIERTQREYPETIFLAEAFTRPKVMHRLAKLGFTQSYTYFAWKHTARDLRQYFEELAAPPISDFFRPNAWPNTPDILNEFLQWGGSGGGGEGEWGGGRSAYMVRHVLAATLCASYGIYGPPFELLQGTPREPGSEEYLDSEKYQLRHWDLEKPESLAPFITRVNRIRRDNPALQQDRTLRFHPVEGPDLLCYSKSAGDNIIICVINVDPRQQRWGTVHLPLEELGIDPNGPFQMHDLLTDSRFTWSGPRNVVGLDPGVVPAHIFRVRRRARSEQDFEYFM